MKVSPRVVKVDIEVTEGRVMGELEPMMSTSELCMTVWPSEAVHVDMSGLAELVVISSGCGVNVKVSPPVVSVDKVET